MAGRELRLGCVVMAAGNASRFGENKLAREIEGRSLFRRTLDAVPAEEFADVVVVTRYPEAAALAAEYGFRAVENSRPDRGISHTIHLGLEALGDCNGAMFLVSDQPFLERATIAGEVELFRRNPGKIVALSHGGRRGNPCVFPSVFFPELMALQGDRGGSAVIRRHEDQLLLFEAGERELVDVDTQGDLRGLCPRSK